MWAFFLNNKLRNDEENLFIVFGFTIAFLFGCTNENSQKEQEENMDFVAKSFDVASQHLSNAIDQYQDITKFPRSTNPDGSLHTRAANNWVSGFFPGSLWYMYEYSSDEKFKEAAIKWTEALEAQQYNTGTHDVGFIINCSYGNGKRLTGNEDYAPS
jgi:unsaturated chondroitin disaccharide hydrolase